MLPRDLGIASFLLLALASPAYGVDGFNSTPGSDLPIGAGGNVFMKIFHTGRIDFYNPAGSASMKMRAEGDIVFYTASGNRTMSIDPDGGITFHLAKNSDNWPIRFLNPYNSEALWGIRLTGPGKQSSGIFSFPSFEAKTNNGMAGTFQGNSGGISVSTEGGSAGTFAGAKGAPAIYATTPWDNGDWAGYFYGDNGILVKPHDASKGLAGWFQGNVRISTNLTVGGVTEAGVPVGVVTVGGASLDSNSVYTANSLRDTAVCATGQVLTKNGVNSFTCVKDASGDGTAGPPGPQGPPGPPGPPGEGGITGYEVISKTCNGVASGNGCYVYCPPEKHPLGGGASIGSEGMGASYNTDSDGLYGWVGINKSHATEDVYVQVICAYVAP